MTKRLNDFDGKLVSVFELDEHNNLLRIKQTMFVVPKAIRKLTSTKLTTTKTTTTKRTTQMATDPMQAARDAIAAEVALRHADLVPGAHVEHAALRVATAAAELDHTNDDDEP